MNSPARFILSILFILVLATGYLWIPRTSYAQTQTPTPTPLAPPAPQLNSEAASVELTLTDWGYEDVILTGPYGYAAYDIGLPLHWEMLPGSSISLLVNFSLVQGNIQITPQPGTSFGSIIYAANVEVALNKKTIYSAHLPAQGPYTLLAPIPDRWPERTGERDLLEVFFRVYGPCQDILFHSLTIYKESTLNLLYDPKPLALDLTDYPAPFYQRTFLPSSVLMFRPEKTSSQLAEAGLSVSAGLGSLSSNQVVITTTTDLDWNANVPISEHGIIIGTPADNRLINYLNANVELPAPLRTRQHELSITGPDVAEPGSHVVYKIQAKNTEAGQANNLSLRGQLPKGADGATCQPDCRIAEGQVIWEVGPLAPGASTDYTLAFDISPSASAEAFSLTTELIQNQEPVNVSTLQTELKPGAQPESVVSQPAGDTFFVLNRQAVAETEGVVQLLPSPWQAGKALLLVSGLTDEAVLKAGHSLGVSSNFPGMSGPVAIVQEVRPSAETSKDQAQDITLAELGYEDLTLTGTGTKEIYYSFDLPKGWALTEDASARLSFSHSPLLSPERSAITMFFNGEPIASATLDETNALSGEMVGPLSSDVARPGQTNTLLVRASLFLDDWCADPESSQSWLKLDSSSSLHLTHAAQEAASYQDLDSWPMPFAARYDLSDVLFSLPASPSDMEYTAATQLSSYLGASNNGDNFRPAALLGEPGDIDQANYHMIVIGRPTRNPVLQTVNPELPQPFTPGTDGIQQQVDDIVLRLPENMDLGYLQSMISPWDKERVLLVVTGTSDSGVQRAASLLVDSDRNWEIEGNLALLRDSEVLTTDTRDLTQSGQLTAIATSLPEATLVGTATAMPPSAPTPAVTGGEDTGNLPLSYPERFPFLLPLIIGLGILGTLVVLAMVYRRSRKNDANH